MRLFVLLMLLTAMCLAETKGTEPGEKRGDGQSRQLALPTAGGYGRFASNPYLVALPVLVAAGER